MAELRATPQSPALGAIAAALRKAQEFAGQYQVLPQIPLLGGTGVDELLGLPGAAREVENWSYGNYPMRINPNAGRTASFIPEVKPGRKSDLADTMLLGLDVAPLASLAGKGVARAARSAPAQAVDRMVREGYESGMIPAPGMTIKPKGGNWLSGKIEEALSPFKIRPVGDHLPEERLALLDQELERMRVNAPDWQLRGEDYMTVATRERDRLGADIAVNKWIDSKLAKYIRNELGTPDDPVKALAERGVLHFQPRGIRDQSPMMRTIRERRIMGGFPEEGTATTPLGQQWERYADIAVEPTPAQVRVAELKNRGTPYSRNTLEENPWLEKLPVDTPVYSPDSYAFIQSDELLGLPHLIDELKAAMDPASELPANLRIDPKDVDKITVPQAVERVARINAWRAEQAAQAEKAGMLENLQATPRMADDSFQLSFVDKPGGAWVDIPETVDEKGMKLCNSIGKAGGWCTQQEWAARSYGSGENRLTALVDTEGRPHAQAKITQDVDQMAAIEDATMYMTPEQELAYERHFQKLDRPPELEESLDWLQENAPDAYAVYRDILNSQPKSPPNITELKPVGNSFSSERAQEYAKRDPDYFRKVENSVLKFLNNGNWGKVADLHHYGIVDLKEPNSLVDAMKTLYGDESSRRVGQEFIDAFNYAVDTTPDAPRFMTQRQLRDFIGPVEDLEGYAGGGLVKGAVDFDKGGKAEFDPKEIANVAEQTLKKFTSLDTPQDMSPAETVADIAAGFVPGIGTAQSARDFERARREGDKLGMGLSAVGMIPVVGGVVKPARKAVDPLAEMLRKYLDKAPSTPSRAAEMRSVQEALARTESRAADAASARQADILSSPETYKEVDWPQRFYRGIRQATRGPNGEMLPEVSSLIMPQRGSEVLAVQPNNPRRTAWAASNPLTASSFASDPNSLVVPLRLREKPDVVFNAEGLPWQRFFSQTGDLSRGSYNYPLRSEFKDMLRDPSVRSILVKDIFDDAANTPERLKRLSELYGVQLRPENLLSDNLLIKDPSVVEYLLTKETPKMTESLKSKSSPKLYAEGGLVDYDPDEIAQIAERATQGFAAGGLVRYDPNEIDTIVSQLKEEFHG